MDADTREGSPVRGLLQAEQCCLDAVFTFLGEVLGGLTLGKFGIDLAARRAQLLQLVAKAGTVAAHHQVKLDRQALMEGQSGIHA